MTSVPGRDARSGQDVVDASSGPAPSRKPAPGPADMKLMGTGAAIATGRGRRTDPPSDVGHTSWGQRVRSLVLGPHGGGTTRRRASDAVRVGLAAVLLVICIPLVDANTSVEIHVTELITPPPSGIRWLITAIWFVGSLGVTAALILLGLLVPRLKA